MKITRRVGIIAGSVLLIGALATGAALAAGNLSGAKAAERLQQAVQSGKMTQGEADLLTQLDQVRTSYMEKMKTEIQATIDKAVADGTVTQEQADRLKKRQGGPGPGPAMKGRPGPQKGGKFGWGQRPNLKPAELKAKIEAQVEAGKITREQADAILNRWEAKDSQSR